MEQATPSTPAPALKPGYAVFLACLGQIVWGFSFLFTKMALTTATPSLLLATRFGIAFLLMTGMILTGRAKLSIKGKRILPLLLLGLIEPVLYFYCESYGVMYATSTFAGVMIALIPIAAILASMLFLREMPSVRQAAFSLMPIVGVVLITLSGRSEGAVRPLGVLLLTGAVFCAACSRVISRKTSQNFSPFERTYFMMALGFVVFLAAALIEGFSNPSAYLDAFRSGRFWISAGYLGAFCSVVAYFCSNYAIAALTVTRATVFTSLTTVVSIFAGVVFLGEPMTAISLVGAALILFGIWKVNRV